MLRPSGDQTGVSSSPGSKVNREVTPRERSLIHRSIAPDWPSGMAKTSRFPSGEGQRSSYSAPSPMASPSRPLRSTQSSWRERVSPAR